ncbi:hypothetical protein CDL12_12698 [Handroanthus impetiginosus]|uniref:Uncharacterized protein n=1 Tax=Handroanthus impetiginosus TaxID=429701 RepID=A0A2G9HB00_9LAMI|nr:hypothetical protein CDL12_12698 [Handroanthus impetiginosus]
MEGQQQLRREDEGEEEKEIKMQQFPLESSPYLKYTANLEDYKFIGYGAVEGQLSHNGDGPTTSTAEDGSRNFSTQVAGRR